MEKEIVKLSEYIKELEHLRFTQMMNPVSHLGSGMHFGELALHKDSQNPNQKVLRAASVFCLTNCILATMTKDDYQKIIHLADERR